MFDRDQNDLDVSQDDANTRNHDSNKKVNFYNNMQ